jgi:3-hydroxybutyryl-CoA dehydrogenase
MNSIYKTIGILGGATEALQIASEGVADFATIDRVLREHAGFHLGPFQLLDIAGLDVAHEAVTSIYEQFLSEPRYRPNNIAAQRISEGKLGQKTGQGFYAYVNGEAQMPAEQITPSTTEMPPVWVSTRAMRRPELLQLLKNLGAKIETGASPSSQALSIVAPLGFDVTTVAIVERLDPARTVGIDMLIDDQLTQRRVLATSPATRADMRDAAHALFARDGKAVTVIRDSGGFITQRVVANMINIACDMCQQGLCTPEQIEATGAADLGHNLGPLAMGNAYGPTEILEVLFNIQTVYGDTRYRPSPWLRRRGALGLSLMHVES